MRKFITLFMVLLSAMAVSAKVTISDPGKTVSKPVKIAFGPITHIVTPSLIDIEYTDSPTCSAQLIGSENLMKYVAVKYNNNGVLSVEYSEQIENITGKSSMKLCLSAPDVRTFETKSLGKITITNSLVRNGKTVKVITNSLGSVTGYNLTAGQVKITVNSLGAVKFGNIEASETSVTNNSLGTIEAVDIISPAVRLATNSNGGIKVGKVVCDRMDVSISSLGNITVTSANCESLIASNSSLGNIKISDLAAANVKATSGSNGSIILSGVCETAEFSASGLSSIIAIKLKAKDVQATTASNMASISCYATERLVENYMKKGTVRNGATQKSALD